MSRSMFVAVLGRMGGVDKTAYTGQSAFADVSADVYYAPFIAWAPKHGITAGVGNGKFDPDGLVTREQMAVFFVRYFEAFDVYYDKEANNTSIPADLETVSPWAKEAVLKLWKTGLLAGDGVNFNPNGNVSRAQAAALCMRTEKVGETWYREPGVESDRVSVDPNAEQEAETTDPTKDDSDRENNTDDSGSISNRTYYKVTFVIDSKEEEKIYQRDTLLSTLPLPAQPDVAETDYYYKAVLRAVERGITYGTSETTFSPNDPCSEVQIITFLWRAQNSPEAAGPSELAQGLGEYYYTDAVAWADSYGLIAASKWKLFQCEKHPEPILWLISITV